jgi:hypothetical protein
MSKRKDVERNFSNILNARGVTYSKQSGGAVMFRVCLGELHDLDWEAGKGADGLPGLPEAEPEAVEAAGFVVASEMSEEVGGILGDHTPTGNGEETVDPSDHLAWSGEAIASLIRVGPAPRRAV